MRCTRVWNRAVGSIATIGLCCFLFVSCGETDDGLSPIVPPAQATIADLFGAVLFASDGSEVGVETVEQKDIVAIYFAAAWCGACAGFTPQLVDVYETLGQAGSSFEVVLVSYADTEAGVFDHMTDSAMPWLTVPFTSGKADALTQRYGVQVIPTLIVLDSDGNTITVDGRADVVTHGAAAYDIWLDASGG